MSTATETACPRCCRRAPAVGVVALVGMFRMFGLFALLPVLSIYAADLEGATPLLIGLAVGAYGLTQAALQIPLGAISDRVGRLPVILVGLAVFALGSVLAAESSTHLRRRRGPAAAGRGCNFLDADGSAGRRDAQGGPYPFDGDLWDRRRQLNSARAGVRSAYRRRQRCVGACSYQRHCRRCGGGADSHGAEAPERRVARAAT